LLVVSENLYPGWEATVDGSAAAILRANYLLRAAAAARGPPPRRDALRRARGALALALTLLAPAVLTFTAFAGRTRARAARVRRSRTSRLCANFLSRRRKKLVQKALEARGRGRQLVERGRLHSLTASLPQPVRSS